MTSTTSATERVGRYQLLEPIGIGPSGEVSRAKVFGVAGFERQFAVKRFHAELTTTAAMAAMMSAAARAYGSLEHPRIARMSEFGVAQGATFTAVEYVLGLDALRLIGEARLAGVTLAAGGALALVSQAARAVGYAHGRGLTHLGLAPTNVIVTAEGDIKITDFGILSATLPQRPIETPRLAQRIPYLAPEQLANEATSAATDVFALGVLAYELVTGSRTFKGDTPQQIASSIMTGPPAEPPLPRPIVRVLLRCLARSPFERFPDARALADALDAALRVAPVPGTRKDIGAQVKETLDRLAALNEGQMSGVVALHLGTGPVRRLGDDDDSRRAAPARGRGPEATRDSDAKLALDLKRPGSQAGGPVTVVGGPVTVGGPPPSIGPAMVSGGEVTVGGPASTVQDLPQYPISTMPGVPPPPIPVPPGVGTPAAAPPLPAQQGASTLLGVGKAPPLVPPGPPAPPGPPGPPGRQMPRPGSSSGLPAAKPPAPPAAALRPSTRPGTDLSVPADPASTHAQNEASNETSNETSNEASSDSAIHTLDPNDVMSIDSGLVNIVELDALADNAAGDTASAPAKAASAVLSGGVTPSSVAPKASRESSLEGPSARRSAPRIHNAGDDVVTLDDDQGLDADDTPDGVTRSASAGTVSGQTILGFAAPLPLPRATTPSPHAQIPPAAADHESSSDAEAVAPSRRLPTDAGETLSLRRPATASDAAPSGSPVHRREALEADPEEAQPPDAPSSPAPSQPQPLQAREVPPGWMTTPPLPATAPASADQDAQRPRRRSLKIALGVIGAAIASAAAWQIYLRVAAPARTPGTPGSGSTEVAKLPSDAQLAVTPAADAAQLAVTPAADAAQLAAVPDAPRVAAVTPDAGTPPSDAGLAPPDAPRVATTTPDAGTPPGDAKLAPPDAGQVVAVKPGVPAATGDMLAIASTPPGARVFLDGSDTGATPIKLPGSPDRHTIALLLAGHELYVAQVDGHGAFQIPLKEVTPTNGPAGIKVMKCKDKDRYYVFIDGKPTGQTCPTERIGCEVGPHTVEVYDVVSETRRKWDIVVKDTRLSFRVRVE